MKLEQQAAAELTTTPQNLVDLLLDYGRYADWLPGLDRSLALAQEGDIAVAEFEAPDWFPNPVTFEFVHTEPLRIAFQQTGQLGEGGLSGTINVDPARAPDMARVEINACLRAPLFGFGIRRRLREALQLVIESLATHLESQVNAAARASKGGRRLILQVRRQEGALEIWYRGKVFTSPPAAGAKPL